MLWQCTSQTMFYGLCTHPRMRARYRSRFRPQPQSTERKGGYIYTNLIYLILDFIHSTNQNGGVHFIGRNSSSFIIHIGNPANQLHPLPCFLEDQKSSENCAAFGQDTPFAGPPLVLGTFTSGLCLSVHKVGGYSSLWS